MKEREGELSYHSRVEEGGIGIFICISDGQIILIDHDRITFKQSPYINRYGETFNAQHKKWDNFYVDEESGGKMRYDEIKRMYVNFKKEKEVVKERS